MVGVRGGDVPHGRVPNDLQTGKQVPPARNNLPPPGKMSTLDYLKTKVRKHVRSTSDSGQLAVAPRSVDQEEQPQWQQYLQQMQQQQQNATKEVSQYHVGIRLEEDGALKSSDDEEVVVVEDASLPAPQHRPPSRDPEHYALALAGYARTHSAYLPEPVRDKKGRPVSNARDGKGANGVAGRGATPPDMCTRQFSSLPELLRNLREDLSVAYISFVKELVREPHDCAWLLLDLLRTVQQAQTALHSSPSSREQQSALRRALLDEHSCLCCLRYCLRCADTALKLADYQHGLYPLTLATMSDLARSRTVALQLLTRVCESSPAGHRQVLDAFATLRLRFAESVRCKFLVSMLQSHPTPSFAVWSLRLVNALSSSAESLRQRIHLQEELLEAGFDPAAVKKTAERNGVEGAPFSAIQAELERWTASYVDVTELGLQLDNLHTANRTLSHELSNLREANMKLLEENVLLKAVGGEVQEQFLALQRRLECNGLPSAPSPTPSLSDSDVSSLGPVRRGTVLRRPSRSSSNRSYNTETTIDKSSNKEHRTTTPDVLPRRSSAHVSSDTFTYASGRGVLKELTAAATPEPMPRSTSLSPGHETNEEYTRQQIIQEQIDSAVIAPCYVNPMDLRMDDIGPDDTTLNRYTPPMMIQRQLETIPGVHQKSSDSDNSSGGSKAVSGGRRSKSPKHRVASSLKRRAPQAPSATNETHHQQNSSSGSSHLSSSTSSLSSASSAASSGGGVQRDVVCYQNEDNNTSSSQSSDPTYQNGVTSKTTSQYPNGVDTTSSSESERHRNSSGRSNTDPDYQNVPRRLASDQRSVSQSSDCQTSEEGDYERNMVVYEAITLGNDMIELVSRGSSSGASSQTSSANRNTNRSNNKRNIIVSKIISDNTNNNNLNNMDAPPKSAALLDNYVQLKNNLNNRQSENSELLDNIIEASNVRESVKHYENMVIAESERVTAEVDKQVRKNKLYANSKELNDSENGSGDSHMKSAESSLSLESQDTVKENSGQNRNIEDRASPDGRNSDELEIVPSRQPQMPPKVRSSTSQSSYDPIMLFEFDSPTETSDTETLNRRERCPPSPRTIETESTRSFGYIQPEKGLRRRDTFVEQTDTGERSRSSRKRGLRRSESFQAGDSGHDGESSKSYVVRRRGSTDLLIDTQAIDTQQHELYINGRTFTRYSPQDVIINNEVNELLTAALNRRQCRSVEDRLDQWLEEDLRRHQPEALQKQQQQQQQQQQPRNRSRNGKKRGSGRSSSTYDDNRFLAKFDKNNNKNRNSGGQKQGKSKPQQKRFSKSDLIAFNGFMNPSPGFIESDYGSNFMLNRPTSKRKTEFLGDTAEFGVHDFPATGVPSWPVDDRWTPLAVDPAIPTPDYGVTPAGTLNPSLAGVMAHRILDTPSGLY